MRNKLIPQLASLRMAIGFLGEQPNTKWWNSSFCSSSSKSFLAPVFPRSYLSAQFHGLTVSAANIHDAQIGIGGAFHLFRLPENMERQLHDLMCSDVAVETAQVIRSLETAIDYLRVFSKNEKKNAVGPVRVGAISSLQMISAWQDVAAYYLTAFEKQKKTLPFFSDRI